jgi:glycosyl transferase family 2
VLNPAEALLFALTALGLGLPVWWAWRLVGLYLFRPADPPLPEADLPKVAVLLPLRGADPSLRDCLRGLLRQDYPRYSVRVVVDSPEDPAWEFVRAALAEGPGSDVDVRASTLKRPCPTCTLKVSAQMQAIGELEDSVQVIALIDADVVPPRDWLRTLVAPFADPAVGGVTGVRWFAPARPTWGALLRHLWNAGSQPQMAAFALAWGGTMALHARVFRHGGLSEHWERSYADDASAADLIRRLGLKLRTLPALTMVNREAVGLPGCLRFLPRQVLGGRLDLSRWPLIAGANVGIIAALAVAVTFAALGLALGRLPWSAWFGSALVLYVANSAVAFSVLERRIRRMSRARGEELPPPAPAWKLFLAGVLAQAVQCFTLVAALGTRRVRWRGVDYAVEGPRCVRLVRHRPYRPPSRPPRPDHSVA